MKYNYKWFKQLDFNSISENEINNLIRYYQSQKIDDSSTISLDHYWKLLR